MQTNHIMYSPTIFSEFLYFLCGEEGTGRYLMRNEKLEWKFEVAIPFGFSQESDMKYKWAQPKIVN